MEKEFGLDKKISNTEVKQIKYMLDDCQYDFGIAVSIDPYHEPISIENYLKYRMSGVYTKCKEENFTNDGVIAIGRGIGIAGSYDRPYMEFYVYKNDGDLAAENVYITVDGMVFADCDMSYEMEEYNEPAGCLEDETLAEIMERCAAKCK